LNSVIASVQPGNRLHFIFGFPICHSRRDLTKDDFVDPYKHKPFPNGYIPLTWNRAFDKPELAETEDTLPLADKYKTYFMKILDLAKEKNIPLLLFASPSPTGMGESLQKYYNTVKHIAYNYNVKFINYNLLYDEIDFNFGEDLADTVHLNVKGAAKVSRHLAQIFAEEYGLPDRRGDPAYAQWNDWAEQVMAGISGN
jgi:hypothetical protein